MKRLAYLALGATLLMTVGAAMQPAQAVCNSPRLIPSGSSYVFTPGVPLGTGVNGSTISADFVGAFWGIGGGNLADPLGGNDNGTFEAIGGWIPLAYANYPAYINSTWAASTEINGCIDSVPGLPEDRCMAILLMDTDGNTGTGAFAFLTDRADTLLNYNFEQPGGAPINLVTVPSLSITSSIRTNTCSGATCLVDTDCPTGQTCGLDDTCSGAPCDDVMVCPMGETCVIGTGVDVTVGGINVSQIAAGLYLDPDCPQPNDPDAPAIEGYQVYAAEVPRTFPPDPPSEPPGPAVENWTPVGPVTPLDADPADVDPVSLACTGDTDQYLAAGIVFESGSGPAFVAGAATRFECGANLAEPEELQERKPRSRQLRRGRSTSRGR